jgi:hypothetical protein
MYDSRAGSKGVSQRMDIQAALASSADLSKWFDSSIHSLEILYGDRERMAAALFDQVHEHHKAVALLIKSSLVGSAFSLVRPTLETFVRGLWLFRCASEEEVKNFAKDKIDKSPRDMIGQIEQLPEYDVGVLSKVKKEAWNAMCSYAHGGYRQALHRITPDQIKPNYSESERLEVINSTNAIALLAAAEIFSMARRQDLEAAVVERMRGLSLTRE